MNLKRKSILVTGGAGFIGSHLVDQLVSEGANVVVVDDFSLGKRDNVPSSEAVISQDARDMFAMMEICERFDVDVCYNMAIRPLPESLIYPKNTYDINTQLTSTVCELLREGCFDKLIHFSSSEVYGTGIKMPMHETHPLNSHTPYAASKAASDLEVMSYRKTYGLDCSILRPFNNYGPRQNKKSYAEIIPQTIGRCLRGEWPLIYGDGEQTRDYIYVTDTARAAVDMLKYDVVGEVVNVGSGHEISINYLVILIMREVSYYAEVDCEVEYQHVRAGDVRRHCADIRAAKHLINFKPIVSMEEGIKRTVEWYCDTKQN